MLIYIIYEIPKKMKLYAYRQNREIYKATKKRGK